MKLMSTKFSENVKPPIYERIKQILELAKSNLVRTVNSTQVAANWMIGREIVEEEQGGKQRADYGEQILEDLSKRLTLEYGGGFSIQNLRLCRQFYQTYPQLLLDSKIRYAVRSESYFTGRKNEKENDYAMSSESWKPGRMNPNLSWTHYRILLRVEKPEARAFYEIETIRNNWKTRELERQINSLLYERLALSKDKKGLMRLATKGQEIQKPTDVFKDPLVMEFLGLPEYPKLVESNLEQALINNLQTFLLELGRGFAFVSRQERITLDGDHFYIDLVFYHTILKCYVVIDLKVGKLNHQDLGQLQLYVNYFDQERRIEGDNPTLGLILCTDKNEAVVRYTLGPDQQKKIFASRYKLYLPTEAELKAELRRELRVLSVHVKNERTP
jgi:predicted nuclease of restriction endonuclease-like (RecB) superfamily